MKAKHILVRTFLGRDISPNNTLEIYYDGLDYIVVEVHTAHTIVTLAKLLDCPLRLWQFNPSVTDESIRDFAKYHGVVIEEWEDR